MVLLLHTKHIGFVKIKGGTNDAYKKFNRKQHVYVYDVQRK